MKFKRRLQETVILALIITLSGIFTLIAEAKFLKGDEFDKNKYYDNPNYIDITVKTKNVSTCKDGVVFFEIEQTFNEEYTGEKAYNSSKERDYKFYIDEETDIYDHYFFNWEAFLAGSQPWVSFYITAEDYEKLKNDELKEVHIAAFYETASSIQIYPSYNEVVRNKRLKELGIMIGDENGNFNPYQCLTRAELTKIMVVMSNPDFMEEASFTEQSFPDVSPEHWAYSYIEYAKSSGIIDGYDDGTFKPENDVTIEELLKMTICLLGYEAMAETTGGYPGGYIKTAERLGLTETIAVEYDTHTIRTEAADVINKALDIPLMTENDNGEYIIWDGLNIYPLSTIAIKHFNN